MMASLYQNPVPQSMAAQPERQVATVQQLGVVLVHPLKAEGTVQCTRIQAEGATCVDICQPKRKREALVARFWAGAAPMSLTEADLGCIISSSMELYSGRLSFGIQPTWPGVGASQLPRAATVNLFGIGAQADGMKTIGLLNRWAAQIIPRTGSASHERR